MRILEWLWPAFAVALSLAGLDGARAERWAGAAVVDLELVLTIDGSYSVDEREFRLQTGGLAKAFLDAEVVQARRAGPAIVQEALERDANLVVLGTTYKYNNESHAIENTSFYVLSHAACPVLLWREYNPVYISAQRNADHAYPSDGS